MNIQDVIIKPIITEKAMKDSEGGRYTFVVAVRSAKTAIKQAIEQAFKVKVTSIHTSIIKGRKKRVGMRRNEISLPQIKKAIVTLKKGQSIAIFEPGGAEEKK